MKRYTHKEKQQAQERLAFRNGDVPFVSLELNIPERTLYRWKREWQEKESTLPQFPLAFGINPAEFEEMLKTTYQPGEYTDLREKLMKHIDALTPTLSEDPDLAHRRALALTRLLDRVFKLEQVTRVEKPQPQIIAYETPDGYLHSMPFYFNGLHERAQRAYDTVIDHARYVYLKQQGYTDEEMQGFVGDNVSYDNYNPQDDNDSGIPNQALEAIFEEPFTDDIFNKPQYSGYLGEVLAEGTGFGTIDSDNENANQMPPFPAQTDNESHD